MMKIIGVLKDIGKMIALLATVSEKIEKLQADIETLEHEIIRLDASLEEISRIMITTHVLT